MTIRNVAAVALVILLGLIVGALGLVAADLYTVGLLILVIGGVGAAVLVGEYLIRHFSGRGPANDLQMRRLPPGEDVHAPGVHDHGTPSAIFTDQVP